jgi:N-acetylglutamate synthase-like GNAT family acetyltransferase
VAIAIHHLEYETVVKCSTFKVRPDQRHRGIGTSLLTRVCHDAIREMARTLYITVPQRHTNLMAFLMYHGFDGETHRPPQNRDMVFVKDLIRSPTCQNPRSLNSIKN